MAPSGVDSSTYTALVTGGSRLSEGALIRATVRVRVFGLNLVRLEANIEAAPAQLKKLARLLPPLNAPYAPTPAARSLEEPEPHAERGPQSPPRPPRLVGSRLDEAQHLLDEARQALRQRVSCEVRLRAVHDDRTAGRTPDAARSPRLTSTFAC